MSETERHSRDEQATGAQAPHNRRLNTNGENERTIGHGVIFAYTAFSVAVSVFVVMGEFEAWNGVAVLGAAFLTLFAGDIAIQRADMNDGAFLSRLND